MADDLTTRYNQLIWQMNQLRNEANEAGDTYANKLRALSKRMRRVNDELEGVSRDIARRQGIPSGSNDAHMAQPVNAGFHP